MSERLINADTALAVAAPDGPPSTGRLANEIRSAIEPGRLLLNSRRLRSAPRGNGRRTILIPGWKAPEVSMAPIGSYLRSRGHDARGWGRGTNGGNVEQLIEQLVGSIPAEADESGRSVNLVGWSLGGVLAREVARELPDTVHRVVTYGTPAVGGPTHTVGARFMGVEECRRINELQAELNESNPITVPITAVFTRRDAAVNWRACIDKWSDDVTTIEVGSTHVGLGVDPDVWRIAAEALAESEVATAA